MARIVTLGVKKKFNRRKRYRERDGRLGYGNAWWITVNFKKE
jgi:hypothetical protein